MKLLSNFPLFIITLLFGYAFGIMLNPIDTYLHEHSHVFETIKLANRNIDFKEVLTYDIPKIKYSLNTKGHTNSNYYKFLEDAKPKYLKDIKQIAIAGMKYTCILYLILIILNFIIFVCFPNYISAFLFGFLIFFLSRSFLGFLFEKTPTSDHYIYLHPETYKHNPK